MARVVSLFLPRWPTDRLRRKSPGAAPSADVPLVLVGREGNRRVVVAADLVAQTAGLSIGMLATKAQALVPGLAVLEADPVGDAEALERLAVWALRFSPMVAADPPDGIVVDTTGADHLHGGEEVLLRSLVDRFVASGIEAQAAIADTWGAAHAAARHAGAAMVLVEPGQSRDALSGMRVTALRLEPRLLSDLHVLGFTTIGDLAAQPRAPLTLRFGPQLGRRLDQAFGVLPEPIDPVRSPDLMEVRRVFGEPIAAAEGAQRHGWSSMGRKRKRRRGQTLPVVSLASARGPKFVMVRLVDGRKRSIPRSVTDLSEPDRQAIDSTNESHRVSIRTLLPLARLLALRRLLIEENGDDVTRSSDADAFGGACATRVSSMPNPSASLEGAVDGRQGPDRDDRRRDGEADGDPRSGGTR